METSKLRNWFIVMPVSFISIFRKYFTVFTFNLVLFSMMQVWGFKAYAAETIKVGIYRFPPFVDFDASGKPGGLTLDILKRLNALQTEYYFTPVVTSPPSRYTDFSANLFDIVLFENLDWGWSQRTLPVVQTAEFMSGGERYIALTKPGRTQSFFDDLSNKKIAGIAGYHYGFAGFNDDPAYLREQHNARLVRNADELFRAVLSGHTDVAVVTESLLSNKIVSKPSLKEKILISERYDQLYSHRVVVRTGMSLSVERMSELMEMLKTDDVYMNVIKNYGGKP